MEDHDVSSSALASSRDCDSARSNDALETRYSEILDYHNVDASGAPTMEGFSAEQ